MRTVIHWFRRDLRLEDNTALAAAFSEASEVFPLYILDPEETEKAEIGSPQRALLLANLKSLGDDIAALGGRLIFRRGSVERELREVLRLTGAQAVYFNREYEPRTRQRDKKVEALLGLLGVELHTRKDSVIVEPDEVLKSNKSPYKVFTPFRKAWLSRSPSIMSGKAKTARFGIKYPRSFAIPELSELGFNLKIPLIPCGEDAAKTALKKFIDRSIHSYKRGRDVPAQDGTSKLSPHLTLGTISPRTVFKAVQEAAKNHPKSTADLDVFISELIWRDFYRQILWHFPHAATSSFKPAGSDLQWENNEDYFVAWREGRTGYPMVDAGMRQLNTTGWMHNRLRMITATFLTKDLLVSWQWGERYFMEKLFDADLASNNGGWQWSASTGTDAQPYFRIFNPMAQAKKFDPEGRFIAKYVPEAMTRSYPAPIVDHAKQRVKALAMFRRG